MKSKSILLVDDEEIIRVTVSGDLKAEGYDVHTAHSGEEGIGKLQNQHFDLVITDLMMEGLDGIQVLKEAKKHYPDLMVLILTGYGSLTSAIDALRLGAADYMLKPCNRSELSIRVSNCLEKQELQKKIKLYENILPMCCVCKKIRDDAGTEPGKGNWLDMDTYFKEKTGVDVSHGYCPECFNVQMKEVDAFIKKNKP